MSNKQTQNKHDAVSETETDRSSDEWDESSSSEEEIKKSSKKTRKEEKKISSKNASKNNSKNSKKVEEKSKNIKRKRVKTRPNSPLKNFEDGIDFDISEKPFKTKKTKISNNYTIERKIISVIDPTSEKKNFNYKAVVFTRKNGDKTFDFNMPLSLIPNIIEGLEYISKP